MTLLRTISIYPFIGNKQLGLMLGIGAKTVANRKSEIVAKLGLHGGMKVSEYAVSVKKWLDEFGE